MALDAHRIDELVLRVPGLTPVEARALGEDVAKRLADRLPSASRPLHLGALDIALKLPPATRKSELAQAIVAAILDHLGLHPKREAR